MMPPESPNKSDELLRRYASERRGQGGDFPLHSATRQMLQGEVTRQFNASRSDASSSWLSWLVRWRRGFIAAGACVVVAVVCWAFWEEPSGKSRMQLAKTMQPERELAARSADRKLAEAPAAPTDTLERSVEFKKESLDLARLDDSVRQLRRSELSATATAATPAPKVPSIDAQGPVTAYYFGVAATNAVANFGNTLQDATLALNLQKPAAEPASSRPLATANYQQSLTYSANVGAGTTVNQPADRAAVANAQTVAGLGIAMNQAPAGQQVLLQNEFNSTLRRQNPAEADKSTLADVNLAANDSGVAKAKAQSAAAPVLSPAAPATAAFGGALVATASDEALGRVETRTQPEMRFYRLRTNYSSESIRERETTPALQAVAVSGFQVLDNFVVEQNTNGVRVVDADGSVYVGQIDAQGPAAASEPLSESIRKDLDARQETVAGKLESPTRGAGYSFRAVGSNITLRQNIEVRGRFATDTNGSTSPGLAGAQPARRAIAPTEPRRTGDSLGLNASEPAAVEGTVRVGRSPEQRFRAVRQVR